MAAVEGPAEAQAASAAKVYHGSKASMKWGVVQVTITVSGRRITGVSDTTPKGKARSLFINDRAEPILKRETLKAQNARIQLVSGATLTSRAWSSRSSMPSARPISSRVADPPGRWVEHVMGMPIVVEVGDPGAWSEPVEAVFRWFRFVDETFSLYRPESEMSRLNRGDLALGACHAAVRSVLRRCEELREATGGYFDARAAGAAFGGSGPAVAGTIDPSGLVKGWAVEGASRLLARAGAQNHSVNAGGDIRLRGGPRPGEPWRIGIQHPRLRDRVAAVLVADDLAVATSGAYERGEHVVDPHTGRPPEGVLSVTIAGPDLALADAYATAAFAMGRDGPGWTAGLGGYGAMTIMADETVLTTPAFGEWRES